MVIWYRINKWDIDIKPMEFLRSTDSFLIGKDRREAKCSEFHKYFPTREQAVQALVERATRKIETLKQDLSEAESDLLILRPRS